MKIKPTDRDFDFVGEIEEIDNSLAIMKLKEFDSDIALACIQEVEEMCSEMREAINNWRVECSVR